MSEPTITMTLSDFKRLESAEKALNAYLSDKNEFCIFRHYCGDYIVSTKDSINSALIERINEAVQDRERLIKEWKQKHPKDFK